MIKCTFLKTQFQQVQAIGDGRYYFRAIIREESDELVLASERTIDHNPSQEEITKENEAAAAENSRMTREEISNNIANWKQELSNTDYKVVKNYEWAEKERALGHTVEPNDPGFPYRPADLFTERQAIRDQINQYENELAAFDAANNPSETSENA